MVAIIFNPYKLGSRSAKAIKEALKADGINSFCLQRAPRYQNSIVVNWGNSEFDYPIRPFKNLLNNPVLTKVMSNKLRFFEHLGRDCKYVIDWTKSNNEAMEWAREGSKVVARKVLEGSGGVGIEIFDPEKGGNFPAAPLYTRYQNKTHEYRVHISRPFREAKFEPMLVQRKIFRKGPDMAVPKDWAVRNHDNGFIFVVHDAEPCPDAVIQTAKNFMEEHFRTMHFVALDIIYNAKKQKAWVIEGNTAPGVEGNTIQVYKDYFKSIHKELTL